MSTHHNIFNEKYYATACGSPVARNKEWLGLFDGIANNIVTKIRPRTVLDGGCAWGFLVESLRKHGVDAWGVDISEYAIQQVLPAFRPYCWVDSLTEPLPRKYDLIVTIEVLEHLLPEQSDVAVANLCAASNDILFSSTPEDKTEATHFNVRPAAEWIQAFARHGFKQAEFDAGFITKWAMRFVRL
jgi:2-polyprenyl-3-methyl-5-hydroxy-6-metoxy-1,4-benzoquinol methylase